MAGGAIIPIELPPDREAMRRWCMGLPFLSSRQLNSSELRYLESERIRMDKCARLKFFGCPLLFVLLVCVFQLYPEQGPLTHVVPGIIMVVGFVLVFSFPVLVLFGKDDWVTSSRIKHAISAQTVERYGGSWSDDGVPDCYPGEAMLSKMGLHLSGGDASQWFEILPDVELIFDTSNGRPLKWSVSEIVEVAAIGPDAYSVPLPPELAGYPGDLRCRHISAAELREISAHITMFRRIKPLQVLLVALVLPLVITNLVHIVSTHNHYVELVRDLCLLCMVGRWILVRSNYWSMARGLQQDIKQNTIVIDDKHGIEGMFISQLMWSERSKPVSWRLHGRI